MEATQATMAWTFTATTRCLQTRCSRQRRRRCGLACAATAPSRRHRRRTWQASLAGRRTAQRGLALRRHCRTAVYGSDSHALLTRTLGCLVRQPRRQRQPCCGMRCRPSCWQAMPCSRQHPHSAPCRHPQQVMTETSSPRCTASVNLDSATSSLPSPTAANGLQVHIQGTTRGRAHQRTSHLQMCWVPSCATRSVCMCQATGVMTHCCMRVVPIQHTAGCRQTSGDLLLPLPQIGAPDAVQQYAAICSARARELRAAAAGQLQRAARYLALRDEVWHKQ